VAHQNAQEARQLAQQRFSHQLLLQQIQNKINQALAIEDEARKRSELSRLHQKQKVAFERELALDAEQHTAAWQALALANAARKREAERMLEWDEQIALARQRALLRAETLKDAGNSAEAEQINQKIEALRRSGAQAESIAQSEKLLRTIEADGKHTRQTQQIALEAEQHRHTLRQQEQEAQWQQELRRLDHERAQKSTQLTHEAELARIEISRVETIGAMSDSAKVALAAGPNAAALADIMKTQLHAGMSPQQLSALANVVGATNSVTPAEAARQAEQRAAHERTLRDADLERDQRHQLNLLAMQNDVNKTALVSQSALGTGVAQAGKQVHLHQGARCCANGHLAKPTDKFCAECGAALVP
jgi:hypothetical protein